MISGSSGTTGGVGLVSLPVVSFLVGSTGAGGFVELSKGVGITTSLSPWDWSLGSTGAPSGVYFSSETAAVLLEGAIPI